jgi:hypothetical protein
MKIIFYLLNFTWGIIMNIFGLLGALVMCGLGIVPTTHAGSVVFRVGHNWGGVSLGIFCFVCEEAGKRTLNHEFGHSVQNAILGPLFPFIVAIPSFTRYWIFVNNEKKGIKNPDYDSVWFEGSATQWGTDIAKRW